VRISGDGKILAAATKDLWRKWLDTRESWKDAKSDEFERKFVVELSAVVDRSTLAFDRLDKLANTIREQCE
jgi:hypothetical protein